SWQLLIPVFASSDFKNGRSSTSSLRKLVSKSSGGASGGSNRSSSKVLLSASDHCKSSIQITSDWFLAIRRNNSRSASNARRLSAEGSGISRSRSRALKTKSI